MKSMLVLSATLSSLYLLSTFEEPVANSLTVEDLELIAEQAVTGDELTMALYARGSHGSLMDANFPNSVMSGNFPDSVMSGNFPDSVMSGNFPTSAPPVGHDSFDHKRLEAQPGWPGPVISI